MNDEQTFQQRALEARESRLADLRAYFYAEPECELRDMGTLDTVIQYGPDSGDVITLTHEDAASYRDEETGEFDWASFEGDYQDEMREQLRERFYEYGLAFDYVPAGTFTDQECGYFRFQISYGGPSEEIRFFCDPDLNLYKAEFWYLDWFKGERLPLTGADLQWARDYIAEMRETESLQHALAQARDT